MDKKTSVISVVVAVIIIVLIILIWNIFSDTENGIIPGLNGNEEPTIERTEWAFKITEIKDLNEKDYNGDGVVIGIVDSGIDISHPDLDHINITAWADYVGGASEPYDDHGHGTHIAGIIAASGEIRGIAPKVDMVVVKAISSDGSGTDSDVAEGIRFAVDNGADVICLSLGGEPRFLNLGDSSAEECNNAIDKGVYVVAAAGNDGDDGDDGDVASPAIVERVIAVGAVDEDENLASFSSIGDNDGEIPGYQVLDFTETDDPHKKPELVAPGVDIISTYLDKGYAEASGTSQATAFVAGGIVLLLDEDAHPEYKWDGALGGSSDTVIELKDIFLETAKENSNYNSPHDDHYGYGLVQFEEVEAAM
jgi:subtilisin family serine protease